MTGFQNFSNMPCCYAGRLAALLAITEEESGPTSTSVSAVILIVCQPSPGP
jgi:hypothetical protein